MVERLLWQIMYAIAIFLILFFMEWIEKGRYPLQKHKVQIFCLFTLMFIWNAADFLVTDDTGTQVADFIMMVVWALIVIRGTVQLKYRTADVWFSKITGDITGELRVGINWNVPFFYTRGQHEGLGGPGTIDLQKLIFEIPQTERFNTKDGFGIDLADCFVWTTVESERIREFYDYEGGVEKMKDVIINGFSKYAQILMRTFNSEEIVLSADGYERFMDQLKKKLSTEIVGTEGEGLPIVVKKVTTGAPIIDPDFFLMKKQEKLNELKNNADQRLIDGYGRQIDALKNKYNLTADQAHEKWLDLFGKQTNQKVKGGAIPISLVNK
jgi:hypothetical protein